MRKSIAGYLIDNHVVVGPTGEAHMLDPDAEKLICNICDWVSVQSMDREDTIETLMCLFDGVLNVTREDLYEYFEEIENWVDRS